MMEFFNERLLKARKPHICEMCGREIKTGEIYRKETGVFYGEFFSRNLHNRCAEFEAEYCSNVENEFTWDEIYDYIVQKNCSVCSHLDENEGICRDGHDIFNCPLLAEKTQRRLK